MVTTTAQPNRFKPEAVSLPGDIEDYLSTICGYYAERDVDRVMGHLSEDFLHQGVTKKAFEARLRESYLLERVDKMELTILRFERQGNAAELTGFAETNLGVMPAAEELLPLTEGSRLVLEHDGWKILGNQSRKRLGLYREFHQLSTFFAPADVLLYRSLLPPPLQRPREPMVFVKVAANERTRLPLPPYTMAHVQLLAEYQGLLGWYTLTMPETEWMPVEMGRTIGYPKFVADAIQLEESDTGWEAQVAHEGEEALQLSIRFREDPSGAAWFERMTSDHPLAVVRKMLPPFKERPWFLLMPVKGERPGGQVLLLKGTPPISGVPHVRERFGTVQLSIKTDQPWAGLIPEETIFRGVLMQFSGELMLRHRLLAVL